MRDKHLAIALLAALGCSEVTTVCTALGCVSGVTVHLSSVPAQPFRVEVGLPSGDVAYVFDCTSDSRRCRQDLFFPDYVPDRLFVTVRVGATARVTEIAQVNYARFRPNGPTCAPECQTATVTAEIPQ